MDLRALEQRIIDYPRKLTLGVGLFVATAIVDTQMTWIGMAGHLEIEGNPILREMMRFYGVEFGLVLHKVLMAILLSLVAIGTERSIRQNARWITVLPSTARGRAWMASGDRSWIAYIPLYAAAVAQIFAVIGWCIFLLIVALRPL